MQGNPDSLTSRALLVSWKNLEAPQHSSPFLCQPVLQGKGFKWFHSLLLEFLFYFRKSVKKYLGILDNNISFLVYCPMAKLSIAKDLPHAHTAFHGYFFSQKTHSVFFLIAVFQISSGVWLWGNSRGYSSECNAALIAVQDWLVLV